MTTTSRVAAIALVVLVFSQSAASSAVADPETVAAKQAPSASLTGEPSPSPTTAPTPGPTPGCSSHSDCHGAFQYCDTGNTCSACSYCGNQDNNAIDGTCPDHCDAFTTAPRSSSSGNRTVINR